MSKIPEDIRKLAERIHAAKEKKKRKEMSEKGNERGNSGAIIAFQISTDLISGILVGAGIGYILDEIFDTSPVLLLIFIIFGYLAGTLNIYRYMKKIEEEEKEKE